MIVHRRNTDRFLGSLGLFLLRLVTAAIMLVRGLEIVTNIPAAQASFAQTRIPEPGIMAIVTGVSALLIAVALVFGLFVRVAGLGITLIAAGRSCSCSGDRGVLSSRVARASSVSWN